MVLAIDTASTAVCDSSCNMNAIAKTANCHMDTYPFLNHTMDCIQIHVRVLCEHSKWKYKVARGKHMIQSHT